MRAVWRRRLGRANVVSIDLGGAGLGGDRTGVADLAAALGVERGLVEEDLDELGVAITARHVEHVEDPGNGVVGDVAEEHRDAVLLDDAAVGVDVGVLPMDAAGRLRPLALLGHLRLEPGEIDRDATLRGDLLGQLEREPVGVVEGERRRTRQDVASFRGIVAELALEDRQPVAQRVAEVLLLLAEHADDEVTLAGDVGISGCPSRRWRPRQARGARSCRCRGGTRSARHGG